MITVLKFAAAFIFAAVITVSDFKTYKIKNKCVLAALSVGLILGIVSGNIGASLGGMAFPLVLFPLYVLRMLGAGDVKALCAIGAILGFHDSVRNLLFTFLAGGAIGIVFLVVNKNGLSRFRYLWNYLKSCFLTGRIEKYDFGGGEKSYFRFAYAIVGGLILTALNNWLNII